LIDSGTAVDSAGVEARSVMGSYFGQRLLFVQSLRPLAGGGQPVAALGQVQWAEVGGASRTSGRIGG